MAGLGIDDSGEKAQTAVELLEKVINLKGDSAEAYFASGSLMEREGDYQQAAELLEKSVQLNGNDPITRYRLGRVYARMGKRAKAIAFG